MRRGAFALLLVLSLTACGRKGDPLPSGLRLPAAPASPAISGPDGRLTLSWKPPREDLASRPLTGLSGYEVLRAAWPPGKAPCDECPEDLGVVGRVDPEERHARKLPPTVWEDPDARPGWTYRYRVRALDAKGRPGRPTAPVTVGWRALPSPAVEASSGDAQARIRLGRPEWPEGVAPRGARVYDAEGRRLAEAAAGAQEVVVSPLPNGREACLSVRLAAGLPEGWDVEGPGARVCVTPADTAPPLPPPDLVAVADPGAVRLHWLEAGGEPYAEVVVLRAVEGRAFVEVGRVPGGEVTWSDTSVVAGTTYLYTLVARDAAGNRSLPTREARVRVPRESPAPEGEERR